MGVIFVDAHELREVVLGVATRGFRTAQCSGRELVRNPPSHGVVVLGRASFWPELSEITEAWRCRTGLQRAILLVVGSASSDEIVSLLGAGVDDYIDRALPCAEVTARIVAHARRSEGCAAPDVAPAPCGSAPLTRTELRLVHYLAGCKRATEAEVLAAEVLGRSDSRGRGRDLVYKHMANIKRKLELSHDGASRLVREPLGYRLLAKTEALSEFRSYSDPSLVDVTRLHSRLREV